MAKFIARDTYLEVDGVDLSDHIQKISAPHKFDNIDVTGMGATYKERLLGLGDFSVAVTLFQDYGAGSVFSVLHAVVGSNTPTNVVLRPVKANAVSSTNPNFTFLGVVDTNDLVNAQVGQAAMVDLTIWNADQTGVTVTYT